MEFVKTLDGAGPLDAAQHEGDHEKSRAVDPAFLWLARLAAAMDGWL
jgi:hypothetical protein